MDFKGNDTHINRRMLLTRGSTMAVATGASVVASNAWSASQNEEDLSAKILQVISELEAETNSELAAITWSRQHIANKLRASLGMPVEQEEYNKNYRDYYNYSLQEA
ncbi:hypothetical protein [Pseudovibrio sp. WM33]|uniref:hypothetical protein n=1 Tax=Pseudovibrio sp. WM33 TaxID=1735585 RepID=UPI0007B20078|nr:hypothetical protein [Pseudovibrio sp. WM33]KZL17233.1 hypothetical protein PsWM33_05371 [Pseudovibrio sp. WM33]